MKLKELIPLFKKGLSMVEIAKIYGVKRLTVQRWADRLRQEGYKVAVKRGRPRLKI